MERKCNKYEAYFTFAAEEEYKAHIENCEDCLAEKEKEEKLSLLIKDSLETYKELLKAERKRKKLLKIACSIFLFISFASIASFDTLETNRYKQYINSDEISIISEEGLPVDEYGFFDYQ